MRNCMVLLLGICVLRSGFGIRENMRIKAEFKRNEWRQDWFAVAQGNFREVPIGDWGADTWGASTQYTVTLTRPIRYYMEPSVFSEVAVELKAGETYVIVGEYPWGGGNQTLPTDRRNWRCASPFVKAKEDPFVKDGRKPHMVHSGSGWTDTTEQAPRYYVRLSDLQWIERQMQLQLLPETAPVVASVLRENLWHFLSTGEMVLNLRFCTRYLFHPYEMYPNRMGLFFRIDTEMYDSGSCIPVSMLYEVWDGFNTLLLTGAVLCLIIPPLYQKLKKRREPTTD